MPSSNEGTLDDRQKMDQRQLKLDYKRQSELSKEEEEEAFRTVEQELQTVFKQMELSDPLNNVSLIKDDVTRSNIGSSGDSEKMIQRLNDELREAQDLANTEKHKCSELQGQLHQLQDEVTSLREQIDDSASARDELQIARGELQSARDQVKSLKRDLEAGSAQRDRDIGAVQANLATVSKELDKWRETAHKYENEIENLQQDLQQQSEQWQKTAQIQADEMRSLQVECKGLQMECSVLRSEKQDILNEHQVEKSSLQSYCEALSAEKEDITKTHLKDKDNLQSECAALHSENKVALQKWQQLETELTSSRAQNAEQSRSLKGLERSQQELEKRLADLQLQQQHDNTEWQTKLEEAESRSEALQREAEEAKAELLDAKDKYEKMEQEKQSLTDELDGCKANMKEIQERGTKNPWMIWGPVIAVALTAAAVQLKKLT
ncbi:sarcolemma associated protein b isoform X2 [Solea solea]|uniref:sarcolemma associated protein b isoform X2 n=1 Tax=Solea solea TaxID=90069 RepID=UPI00272A74D9|nr:sarcolemma associated protein b isoform X2 [Solea solea]